MRMNKFWLVFRTQFFAAVSAGKAKRRSRVDKAATFSGYALGWLVITALASFYEFIYGVALINSGFPDAFPTLIIFAASILTLFTSISYTKSLIFCSKDHDMLFALPIRGSVIVAAKIATLYVLDLAVTLAILLPCGVIYGYFVQPSWLFYVLYYTVVLFVPMLPILIAAFVSALVSLIASRFRRAKIVGTVLYIAIFFAFMLGVMNISQSSEEELSQIITGMTEAIYSFYPPLAWASDGISGNPLMYLLFIGVSLAAFAVIVLVFGRFYGKIHGLFSARSFRSKYKISAASGSAKSALVKKELARFFSSPGLMLNQLSGLLMMVIFMIIFMANGRPGGATPTEQQTAKLFVVMFPYLFSLCASTACLTNASISLEGKTFGLLKSLPVSARTVLSAKLRVHEIVSFPVILICCTIMTVYWELSVADALVLFLLPLLTSYNTGVLGLLLNLKKYNFDWTNEVMVAKNSLPVVITVFGGMFLTMIPGIIAVLLMFLDMDVLIFNGIFIGLYFAASVGLTVLLRSKGEKMFAKIGE